MRVVDNFFLNRWFPLQQEAKFKLSLPLFEAGILLVDNIQSPFSSNNFAICAAFFYGCPDFHFIQCLSISV
jgi:hypothetical protein